MLRSLAVIVAAIRFSAPDLSPATAKVYARTVQAEARNHHFDPFTMIAMVHFESHWRAEAESPGGDVGLGQVRLSNYAFCRSEPQGERCQAKRAALKNGSHNLRVVAGLITRNREFCRKRTGRPALFRYWLASYQGTNRRGAGHWCGQVKKKGRWVDLPVRRVTSRVMAYRIRLIKRTERRRDQ